MSLIQTSVRAGQKFYLVSSLLLLQGCAAAGNPLLSTNFPPPGPPNFEKGMLDGCKTAASAIGAGTVLGAIYNTVQYDVDQSLNDKVYARAWQDGYHYCKYSMDSGLLT